MLRVAGAVPIIGVVLLLFAPTSKADIITEIAAAGGVDTRDFAVLYEGSGQLHISGATASTNITGDIGIGGTGSFKGTGSGTLNGTVDFSAPGPTAGQCTTSGAFGFNCASANYDQTGIAGTKDVSGDLTAIGNYSATVASWAGPSVLIDLSGGSQTINASSGDCTSHPGNCVFNVNTSSFNFSSGSHLVINGDTSGDNVILNFNTPSTLQFQGTISFTGGLTPDQVLFNITGGGELKVVGADLAGDFADPNGQIFVSGSTVTGRLLGGGSGGDGMSLVSGDTITAPTPEPTAIALAATVLLGSLPLLRRKFRRSPRDA